MYDLRFRTDVRFREVCCKEDHFYWHSSRRQLVRVMLTPFFLYCLEGPLGRDLANGKGRRRPGNIPSQMEKYAFLQS